MKIIKTSEALPKSGRYVLAWLQGAKIPMRAMWAAQHTLPLGDDEDPEWGEYSEEKDEYFCPAGWYEMNQHEEQHWGVDGNVVAWCELPRLDHQCLAQIEEPAQPVCWIRFCSDGSTEGPIMHSQICEARKTSGAWTPLYAGAAPAAVSPRGEYPQLPEAAVWSAAGEDGMPTLGKGWMFSPVQQGNATLPLFTAQQMWAYHDLGRQSAPAAPALEAPAAPSWDKVRRGLTALLLGFARNPQPSLDAAEAALDAATEADMPLAGLRMLAAAPQAPAAPSVLPSGWVPCILTHDGQHPEEVAYGPQIMMDRLKKWLGRYFELLAQKVLDEPVHAEMLAALQAVALDVVHVGAGENAISDAARAKVEAVLEKIGAPWPSPEAAPAAPWKDHLTARLVNDLRDCAIKYHGAGQLRDRIAHIVAPLCDQLKAAQAAPAAPVVDGEGCLSDELRDLITGMTVSVDVSTGEHDAGNRLFGEVTEVMEYDGGSDKHKVVLLVQSPEANFKAAPAAPAVDADPMAEFLRDTGPAIVWPKARDVGRIGDMSPSAHLRIGLDSDNDVYASIWDERGAAQFFADNPSAALLAWPLYLARDKSPTLEAPAAPACDLFDCEVRPHPLRYPLAAYHHAPGNGPLHATWQDKPHRIVYDLVAAVRHYAALAAAPQAPAAPVAVTTRAELEKLQGGAGSMATIFPADASGFPVRLYAEPAAPAVDVLSPERMREEFIAWAEVAYRHEEDFTKRDFEICLKAWRFGSANALLAAQAAAKGEHDE